MQLLEVSGAVRLIYRSLGVKGLKKLEFSQLIFEKFSNIKFNEKLSSGSRVDGQTDVTKVTVAFSNLVNAPKRSGEKKKMRSCIVHANHR